MRLPWGLVIVASACGDRTAAAPDAAPDGATDATDCSAQQVNRDIDILFVIDNSGSMQEEQDSLNAAFPQFLSVLENIEGGLPNVHIGVVSSNVGVLGQNVSGCAGAGDNGVLQNMPRVAGCTGPQGRFIEDVADGAGGRSRNFTGTLAETFSCVAALGVTGCGFEQHLEAAYRAVRQDQPIIENAGFLRPDAYLAIIIVADEDDCSANDPELFDPSQDSIGSQLGYLQSFRCYEFGVKCEDENLSREPASYADCEPRTESFMQDPAFYAESFKALKPDHPERVIVAAIVGNPTPVTVELITDTVRCGDATTPCVPAMQPSCDSANGSAGPAIRLAAFLEEFPNRSSLTSICSDNLEAALVQIADLLAEVVTTSCVPS